MMKDKLKLLICKIFGHKFTFDYDTSWKFADMRNEFSFAGEGKRVKFRTVEECCLRCSKSRIILIVKKLKKK
jgi:hypothetical protein